MDRMAHILLAAEKDPLEPLLKYGAIVLFVLIGVLASLIGKLKQKAERERAQREQERYEGEYRQRKAQAPGQAQAGPAQAQPQPPPQAEPQPDLQAQAQAVIAQLFGAEPPAPPPPPPRRPQAQVPRQRAAAKGGARLGEGVQQEVHRLAEDLGAEDAERRRRLDALGKRRLRGIEAAADGGVGRPTGVEVDLSGREAARQAIIYSEILGKPKSLRTDPEPWDR